MTTRPTEATLRVLFMVIHRRVETLEQFSLSGSGGSRLSISGGPAQPGDSAILRSLVHRGWVRTEPTLSGVRYVATATGAATLEEHWPQCSEEHK
jgi:hypothetical protein